MLLSGNVPYTPVTETAAALREKYSLAGEVVTSFCTGTIPKSPAAAWLREAASAAPSEPEYLPT